MIKNLIREPSFAERSRASIYGNTFDLHLDLILLQNFNINKKVQKKYPF